LDDLRDAIYRNRIYGILEYIELEHEKKYQASKTSGLVDFCSAKQLNDLYYNTPSTKIAVDSIISTINEIITSPDFPGDRLKLHIDLQESFFIQEIHYHYVTPKNKWSYPFNKPIPVVRIDLPSGSLSDLVFDRVATHFMSRGFQTNYVTTISNLIDDYVTCKHGTRNGDQSDSAFLSQTDKAVASCSAQLFLNWKSNLENI